MKALEKTNLLWGAVAAVGTAVFGKYWFLFLGFFALNIVDYITGLIYARFYAHNESSSIGAKGILKKVLYWVVIGISFFISFCFVRMGETMGINIQFVVMFGWFTLATYLVNEIRSILENLVKMNVNVPKFLVIGLDVTEKLINDNLPEDLKK